MTHNAPARRTILAVAAAAALAGPAAADYVESYQPWSATVSDAWQVKDLSGAPFNVPADAVVEVAVRNETVNIERWGGVRAVGSTLDRRLLLHQAGGGGLDVLVMHVQADENSQIEHYTDAQNALEFILLGYWTCGTYVETYEQFTAGADASWQDHDLAPYGVASGTVAEIAMANTLASNEREAGVRANGSLLQRRMDLHMAEAGGIDTGTLLVSADGSPGAAVEVYAEVSADVDFYLLGYWSAPPGTFTEAYADLGSPSTGGAWEAVDLGAAGAPAGSVAAVTMINQYDIEGRQMGVRASGSGLDRLLDLHRGAGGAGDAASMHVAVDGAGLAEFLHEQVADAHQFRLTGYWVLNQLLGVADHDAGRAGDGFSNSGGDADAELLAFSLLPCGGSAQVSQLAVSISNISGLTNSDWAGVEIIVDENEDGDIDPGETTSVGGSGSVNQAAGTITFSSSFTVSSTTNYVLRADFASLSDGDAVTVSLDAAGVSSAASVSGTTTPVPHVEGCTYFDRHERWTAAANDTWEVVSLSGPPYDVPPGAVVEVAVRNSRTTNERWGGVREVGSILDRRVRLHEAEGGGTDCVVMHVQTDATASIEHSAEVAADIDFVLLGYWDCGSYQELNEVLDVTVDASWQSLYLSAYGVGPGQVAEIVLSNTAVDSANDAGVRTSGSSLPRIVNLHMAEAGGSDVATMFVAADGTASAGIEAYAGSDAIVELRLVGFWSVPPGAFTELFADIGSPAAANTWEPVTLGAAGVPANAVADVLQGDLHPFDEHQMGIRAGGTVDDRLLEPTKAEGGGGDYVRMQTRAGASSNIEFRHSDPSAAHEFRLSGYWQPSPRLGVTTHDAGPATDAFGEAGGALGAELLAFKLDANIPTVSVSQLTFSIDGIMGLKGSDWSGVEVVVDANDDGTADAGDTTTVGGIGVVDQIAGTITFALPFDLAGGTNYILRANFFDLSNDDQVLVSLDAAGVTTADAVVVGAATAVLHHEGCYYFERATRWHAATPSTWQSVDLGAEPHRVPAGAVVEVAVLNDANGAAQWGGVRAVGSALQRRFELQEAEAEGRDVVVMHVQTDAGSAIEIYASSPADIEFMLLGYWDCGTYDEAFHLLSASGAATWVDADLNGYGIASDTVVEVVLTNTSTWQENEAGVRAVGATHERRVDLHEAETGGSDLATMLVESDQAPGATVQLFAEDNLAVEFRIVGSWSVPPMPYWETFFDVGSPAGSGVWEGISLAGINVAPGMIAELLAANEQPDRERLMGIRSPGSSLDRYFDLHEAEPAGADLGRMHVAAGADATIELLHEDVADAHTFHLIGMWGAPAPRITRWTEVDPSGG